MTALTSSMACISNGSSGGVSLTSFRNRFRVFAADLGKVSAARSVYSRKAARACWQSFLTWSMSCSTRSTLAPSGASSSIAHPRSVPPGGAPRREGHLGRDAGTIPVQPAVTQTTAGRARFRKIAR